MNWETTYSNGNPWGNRFPSDFFDTLIPSLKPDSKILDIGCGDGRNALYLAKLGFEVEAFDISSNAIRIINEQVSNNKNLKLKAWVGDLRNQKFDKKYDLVIAYGVINSLEREHWKSTVNLIKLLTKPDGYNAIIYFNTLSDADSKDNFQVLELAKPKEISKYYSNWLQLKYDIRTTIHEHELRPKHSHVIERYIFKYSKAKSLDINKNYKIAVIGPAHCITKATPPSYSPENLILYSKKIGEFIAKTGNRLVCVPDNGVALNAFNSYSEINYSKPAIVLKPDHNAALSSKNEPFWEKNLRYPFDMKTGFEWSEQAVKLVQEADILVMIGMSCGTLIEVLWTKWLQKPVYMSRDICSQIPPEIKSQITLFELPNFETMLKAIEINHFK